MQKKEAGEMGDTLTPERRAEILRKLLTHPAVKQSDSRALPAALSEAADTIDAQAAEIARLRELCITEAAKWAARELQQMERAEAAEQKIDEALQLDGGYSTLNELVAAFFETRLELTRCKAVLRPTTATALAQEELSTLRSVVKERQAKTEEPSTCEKCTDDGSHCPLGLRDCKWV